MKSYDELTKDLLERRDRYEALQKQKKKKIKRIATPLCCFVLVGLLAFCVWQKGLHQTFNPVQPSVVESQSMDSQQSSREESQSSAPSVVSKESQAESSSTPAKVSNPDSSLVGITDSSVTSKADASDKLEAQEQMNTSSGATPQKPVSAFCMDRPWPSYLIQSDTLNPDDMVADMEASPPFCLADSKSFHSWLQNGGDEEHVRENILNFFAEGSPTLSDSFYYRPKLGDGKNGWQLTNINVYYEELYYNYTMIIGETKTNLGIYIGIDNDRIDCYEDEMQWCSQLTNGPVENYYPSFDVYGSATVKGVEYNCYHFPKSGVTSIYWKVNGITFCAVYDGEYSDVGEILPLLEMEKVSYKIANNGTKK